MAIYILFTGCGKIKNQTNNKYPEASSSVNQTPVGSSGNDIKKMDSEKNTSTKPVQTIPDGVQSQDTKPGQKPGDNSPSILHTEKLSSSQDYSDAYRLVKFLGLKEYKILENDNYTDKAGKGKKFLVLFLSIRNDSLEEDYINYNYISAKVDGKKTSHTFLVNEPKSYPTIFTQIPAGESNAGFIVWEVPSGWKKLELTYNGWKDINNVKLEATFTPEDLSDPVIYNANDYN